MKDFAIYCAGGLGLEIYCLIFKRIKNPEWNFIGFFDDGIEKGKQLQYGICLGGMKELNEWSTPLDLCIANGNPRRLRSISEQIANPLVNFPNIIAIDTWFADKSTVKFGKGNVLTGSIWLSVNVEFGDFNLVNGFCNFGHEAKVGNYNAIMPGTRISGNVNIGNENLLGADSFVLQGIRIGNNVTLSPGGVLLSRPKDGKTYIGNPAKLFKI